MTLTLEYMSPEGGYRLGKEGDFVHARGRGFSVTRLLPEKPPTATHPLQMDYPPNTQLQLHPAVTKREAYPVFPQKF